MTLFCGITPYHIRQLCENGMAGGFGYTPEQVGNMTLDQIYMLLADRKDLRKSSKQGERTRKATPPDAATFSKDGMVKVRTESGEVKMMKFAGKSLVRQAMEAEAKKKSSRR